MKQEVPIWEKSNLTLAEASAYSGIGVNKLREITNEYSERLWFFRNFTFLILIRLKECR